MHAVLEAVMYKHDLCVFQQLTNPQKTYNALISAFLANFFHIKEVWETARLPGTELEFLKSLWGLGTEEE